MTAVRMLSLVLWLCSCAGSSAGQHQLDNCPPNNPQCCTAGGSPSIAGGQDCCFPGNVDGGVCCSPSGQTSSTGGADCCSGTASAGLCVDPPACLAADLKQTDPVGHGLNCCDGATWSKDFLCCVPLGASPALGDPASPLCCDVGQLTSGTCACAYPGNMDLRGNCCTPAREFVDSPDGVFLGACCPGLVTDTAESEGDIIVCEPSTCIRAGQPANGGLCCDTHGDGSTDANAAGLCCIGQGGEPAVLPDGTTEPTPLCCTGDTLAANNCTPTGVCAYHQSTGDDCCSKRLDSTTGLCL